MLVGKFSFAPIEAKIQLFKSYGYPDYGCALRRHSFQNSIRKLIVSYSDSKHLRSVSIAASQRLGILRKSCRVFHDRSLLGRCFRGFALPVLEYCSTVWCSAADTHLKLLDRAARGDRFRTGGVFECDIAHRRSVAVLCMLYKIRYKAMHPLNGALPGPYVPVRVRRGALVTHRTSQTMQQEPSPPSPCNCCIKLL